MQSDWSTRDFSDEHAASIISIQEWYFVFVRCNRTLSDLLPAQKFVTCLYLLFNLVWPFVINNVKVISYIHSNWFPGVDIWILIKFYCIYVILRCIDRTEMENLPKNIISYGAEDNVRWLLMMAIITCSERSCLL